METVILAGGKGSRMGSITKNVPKPLIRLGDKPIIIHIIEHYMNYDVKRFIICIGYLKEKFYDYFETVSNSASKYENGTVTYKYKNAEIVLVDTGLNNETANRLEIAFPHIKEDTFFLTYGDGLSNINLYELLQEHSKCNGIATITTVHPPVRFGRIIIDENSNQVFEFREKEIDYDYWINGGYMVIDKRIKKYFKNFDLMSLEKDIFPILAKENNLYAYKHQEFWQCMDTVKDYNLLIELYNEHKIK